jgi:Phage integrase family
MNRLVHVRRSYTRHEIGPTKSGKVRSVPLVDQAARALDQLSRREHLTGEEDLVFVNAVGDAIEESAMRRRFYRALKRAGLEHLRFHDLRHTFGTIAVQAFQLTDVKAFMGHADIQTTMVYVHHVPQHDAADKLSKLLDAGMSDEVRCTPGARSASGDDPSEAESGDLQEEEHAGGGTRTPDTRIMILRRSSPVPLPDCSWAVFGPLIQNTAWYPGGTSDGSTCGTSKSLPAPLSQWKRAICSPNKHQGPSFEGPWLVAGAGFEPATFGL